MSPSFGMRTQSTSPASSAAAPGVATAPETSEGMWEGAGNVLGTPLPTCRGSRRELWDAETCCRTARGSSFPQLRSPEETLEALA